jgi:acetylornithine aminotransferase
MQLSPALAATGTYPFVQLEQAKRRLAAKGVELIDFGKGDPREPTDPIIRRALADSLTEISTYPLAEGLPELRAAVAGWCERRFGVRLDPGTEIVPTYGSKEAIFLLAQVVVDRDGDRQLVLTTQPGYPVPDRGATFAGAEVEQLPLREEHGFLPDLDAVSDETWKRAAIVWLSCRASTAFSWPATRRTPSSGSTSRPTLRSRCASTATSSSSTRSANARR